LSIGPFQFLDPGPLVDGDLELRLAETGPGDPAQGIVPDYRFALYQRGNPTSIGYIHLRVWLTPKLEQYGGHIGYGVDEAFRGHHYAARSVKLLFPLARRHGINPLLITCGEENMASRRTCELAGGQLQAIRPAEIEPGVIRNTCYYHVKLQPEPGAQP
jgi:predicted acetyltransferase